MVNGLVAKRQIVQRPLAICVADVVGKVYDSIKYLFRYTFEVFRLCFFRARDTPNEFVAVERVYLVEGDHW